MAGCAEDHVCVPVKLLHNLFGLQVPDVHKVVLASAHNPFTTCNTEVGKNAIFFILVSRVGLEALALAVIPQFEGVVEGGRQDIFTIGRELDKADRRIIIINQSLETLTRGRVPDPTEPVIGQILSGCHPG
jgi:hypothetical protein